MSHRRVDVVDRPVAAPPGASAERRFRPDVEGLRALAVLLVVLYHAGVPWVSGGYIGVDVFFVLSGFVITGLLLRERTTTGSNSLLQFYARRVRRILPASTLVVIVSVAASYHYLGFLRGAAVAKDGRASALFVANIHFSDLGTNYLNAHAAPSPLQHFWSLAVEEQFYFVWPALFIVACSIARSTRLRMRLGLVLGLLMAASLAYSVYETQHNGTVAYFSPFTRAWELAGGALVAVAQPMLQQLDRRPAVALSWVGLAGIVGSAFLYDDSVAFPGWHALLPVVGTILVLAGGSFALRGGAERLLGLPPFQWLGKMSFSLYLWHWPILVIVAQHEGTTLPVWKNLLLVLVALGVAMLAFRLVESPIRFAKSLTRSPVRSLVLGACLVGLAYGTATIELHSHPQPQTVTNNYNGA